MKYLYINILLIILLKIKKILFNNLFILIYYKFILSNDYTKNFGNFIWIKEIRSKREIFNSQLIFQSLMFRF